MTDDMKKIADRFALALRGKADPAFGELFGPTVVIFHVYDESPHDVDAARVVSIMGRDEENNGKLLSDYDGAPVTVFVGDDGFVATRTIAGTLPDGGELFFQTGARVFVMDGKIVRVDSYQDQKQGGAYREAIRRFLS